MGQTSLKVSLDSAYLLMGRTTPLHIELTTNAASEGRLVIPKDSMCAYVEILRHLKSDTSEVSSGRIEVKQDIILQSFDSGVYRLNPILYVTGKDTIESNRLVLKVYPADVDSLETIHDYADISDIDRSFIDYLPDFIVDYGLWILGLIIVSAAAWYIYYLAKKKKSIFASPQPKPLPPYEQAIIDLNKLNSEKLCENGQEKEFYTRLTDILRIYLQGRFGINAMEMTSTQIRQTIDANKETHFSRQYINQVLEIADFVKFAKVRPLPDDNVKAFRSALQFVEDTKPAPEPEENLEDESTEESNKTND